MPPRPTDETPDRETLAFETAALRDVAGTVSGALTDLIRAILAVFEGIPPEAGDVLTDAQAKAVGVAVARRIRALDWEPMRPALADVSEAAHRLGVARSVRRFATPAEKAKAASTRTPRAARRVSDVDKRLRQRLREAERVALQGIRTRTEATQIAAKVSGAKAGVEGAVRSTANAGINAGTSDVARTMKLRLLWVAERNACLDCLAHAGHATEPGKPFPPVSFDPKAKRVEAVDYPPLHPNCRCQVRTFDGPAGPPPKDRSSISPAARLAAEARRSVVYQWTEYESGPAMQRAAEALLSAGAGLPASVETRARRMLRAKKRGG